MRLASLIVPILMLAATALIVPHVLDALPGQLREVQGTVERSPGPAGPQVLIVRGDDGQQYYADVSKLGAERPALARGDRVVMTGRTGMNPYELATEAVAALTRAGAVAAPGPSAASPPAPASPSLTGFPAFGGQAAGRALQPPPPPSPERLDGRVESVAGNRIMLRTGDGRTVAVDIVGESSLAAMARPGDELTVMGQRAASDRFSATGHIYIVEITPDRPGRR